MKNISKAGKRILSLIMILAMAVSLATTALAAGPITVGDGAHPEIKTLGPSATNKAISSFTLRTTSGTDTVTGLVVTGTSTVSHSTNVAADGVKIWKDNGSTLNEWDATDTLVGTSSFAGAMASFTGLSITVTTTVTKYIITYNLKATPSHNSNMKARISNVTASAAVTNTDDNDATFYIDTAAPVLSISSPSVPATKSGPVTYVVSYSSGPAAGSLTSVTLNTTGNASGTAAITGNISKYTVTISNITGNGTIGITVPGGIISDSAGNVAAGGTSSTFVVDSIAPTVTIVPASGQLSPTDTAPINFTATFSEPVTSFATGDVTISGTAAGTKTATVTGSGMVYNIAVTGMTSSGTVAANIAAGAVTDAAGNAITAAVSTDVMLADQTLTYYANNGTSDTTSSAQLAGTTFNLAPNTFTQADFTFAGWNTKADGTGDFYANGASYIMPVGGAVLYAQWTPNVTTHTVTFKDGSTVVATSTVNSGGTVARPAGLAKDGYTFVDWYADELLTTAYNFAYVINADTIIYALYTTNVDYNVTFMDGTTALSGLAATVTPGGTISAPVGPDKAGVTFAGWYADAGLTTTYNFAAGINAHTTIYAKYVATVKFMDGVTELTDLSRTVNPGDVLASPTPSKTGYTFDGWYADAGLTTTYNFAAAINAHTTIYAKFTAITYNVTFMDGATVLTDLNTTVSYGGTVGSPAGPTKTGFVFAGWYAEAGLTNAYNFTASISGDTTIYAKYTADTGVTYALTMDKNPAAGGTATDVQGAGSYAAGTVLNISATPATGYQFVNWTSSDGGSFGDATSTSTTFTMPANAVTVTANYIINANTFTVTWMDGAAQLEQDTLVAYGAQPDYNGTAPTKAATAEFTYAFAGWSSNPSSAAGFAESLLPTVTADVIYYAIFTQTAVGGNPGPIGGGGGPIGGGGGGPIGGGGGGLVGGGGLLGVTDVPKVFGDVREGDWYYEAVGYVTVMGLFGGVSDTAFEPNTIMTRGMLVTVLHRMAGSPATDAANPFKDVAPGMWYTNAVVWASQNGIVGGYNSTTFGPNDKLTREQLAVIIYNYAAYKNYDMTLGNNVSLQSFTDASQISAYADNAVKWAFGAVIMQGKTPTTLAPKANASRAEVAQVLMKFIQKIVP